MYLKTSSGVTWGQQQLFADNSRLKTSRNVSMASLCLFCRETAIDKKHNLLGGGTMNWTFQGYRAYVLARFDLMYAWRPSYATSFLSKNSITGNKIPETAFLTFYSLGLSAVFLGGSPTLIWPWQGSNYPSRSCNGPNGPKGPKFKKHTQKTLLTSLDIRVSSVGVWSILNELQRKNSSSTIKFFFLASTWLWKLLRLWHISGEKWHFAKFDLGWPLVTSILNLAEIILKHCH